MRKLGVFFLFMTCICICKVSAAPMLTVNPSTIEMMPGETKTIDIVFSGEDKIVEGSMTIVTSSRYITLVSVTMEESLTAKNTGSTTSFSSKKGISKNEKIGTITIKVLPSAPIKTEGTISVASITLTNDKGKVSKSDSLLSTITVVENKKSDVNTLESLTSEIVEIPFEKEKDSYSIEVDNTVKNLDLVATASDAKADVSISPQKLVVGKNEIVVTVTAENGSKKEYKIEVIRKEAMKEVAPKKASNGKYVVVLVVSIVIVLADLFYIYKRKK